MSLRLRNNKTVKYTVISNLVLLSSIITFWIVSGGVWTKFDYQLLDLFYRQAVKYGHGPRLSSRIVYVTIRDDSYDDIGKNVLDRAYLAEVNHALALYRPEAVVYDIIFARPSHPDSDRRFAESLAKLGAVYLPIGLNHAEIERPFRWEAGVSYDRFRTDYLKKPLENGTPRPYYATRALMQFDAFSEVAFSSGHIGIASDADGVYRHFTMLVKIDSHYFPALALSMFLDYAKVSFEDVIVNWGRHIVIPASKGNPLARDTIIPIDDRGRVFIPYVQNWHHDFEKMSAHRLLQHAKEKDLQGNLTAFFEGKFVIVADISIGTSDVGQTPLESGIPLFTIHASLLNGLLNNTFYRKWTLWQVCGFICLLSVIIGFSTLPKSSWFLFVTGGVISIFLIALTWLQFINFMLFPIVSVSVSFLFIFIGLVTVVQVLVSKDRAFIRHAFSKYVHENVVNELLDRPELLRLGGEERVLTVMFADLEGFSTISEHMTPTDLVTWLNEYLTAMTDIIVAEGGMIDRYIGDTILAEFGAPLPIPDHADRAVRAGIKMQRRLYELHAWWAEKALPQARCRIGINTGPMVIGNLGSRQMFNYTVTGDAANLGARLEGANKFYKTYFMISEFTLNQLTPNMFRVRLLDFVRVKGKSQAVKVFEVYGEESDEVDRRDLLFYDAYQAAFEAYLSRNFTIARGHIFNALALRPEDPASQQLRDRLGALKPDDLPDDWDGAVTLWSK